MKKTILIALFLTLSLNTTNGLDLAEEIKTNELNKIEKSSEDNSTEVISENTEINYELNSAEEITEDNTVVEAEELPETGPEEFLLIFITLFLSSAIFIRKKFQK